MISPDIAATVVAVAVTFLLALAIAWVHRRTYRGTAYSQDFAHTLIITAVVTAVLIGVISSRAGIGLAMFAAFAMIRFPRSLGQASDLAYGFLAIAVAMVSGTGYQATAVLITAIACGTLLFLHRRNAFAPSRASHLLTLCLAPDADFEAILAPVFDTHTDERRLLRQRSSPDGGQTELRYALQLKAGVGMARFIEALHQACDNQRLSLVPLGQEFDGPA